MKKLLLLFSILMNFVGLHAQNLSSENLQQFVDAPQEKCISSKLHERLIQTDPQYVQRRAEIEQHYQAILNNGGMVDKSTYTIPVVVHVIHTGQAVGTGVNISDAQIQSAIDNLNAAYSNTNTAFTTYTGVNTNIQFCLAQRDPSGNPTTGIVRVNGSGVTQYSTKGVCDAGGGTGTDNEVAVKALSKWDNTKYYNIWVVNEINDNGGGAGTQGYAYFPGAGATVDGAIMLYNAFGYDPDGSLGYNLKSYTNRNVTAVHELGHALNLYHTFEGDGTGSTCPTDAVCGTSGDCVSDTPLHKRSTSSCVADGTSNPCQAGTTAGDYQHNFMDYSSDVCQTEFTAGQVTRMNAVMMAGRASLNLSDGCNPVYTNEASLYAVITPASGSECGSSIDPEVTIKNTGSTTLTSLTITYTMDGGAPVVYNWIGSLTQGSTENVTLASVSSTSGAHTFVCTISNPNGVADPYSANDSKTVNYTSTGSTPTSSCTNATANTGNFGTGIIRVQFNTIDKVHDDNMNDGTQDFSCSDYTTLSSNTAYTLTITLDGGNPEYARAYIDYNDDGSFNETDELVYSTGTKAASHSTTVNIPQYPSTTGKLIRMRIISDFNLITSGCLSVDYGETEDYGIYITPPPCSAPVLNSSPSNLAGCEGSNGTMTVSVTGPSLSYQWQISTNGGTSFTNLSNGGVYSGATTGTLTFTGYTAAMNNYQYKCYVSNSCGNVTSNAATLIALASPTAACTPATTNTGNFGTGIVRFQFNTIDKVHNDFLNDGTVNFVCANNTTVTAGSTYAFTVTGSGGNPEYGRIYIDYNDNGTFEAGEIVYNNNTTRQTTHTGNITIPTSGIVTGKLLRIRVMTDYAAITDGCSDLLYGEVEDYGLYVPCLTPTVSSVVSAARCDAGTLVLSGTPSAGTIRWYTAPSAGTLLGTGTSFTTPSIGITTTYYAEAYDVTCASAARTAVTAAIGYCTSKVVDGQCGTTLGGVHQAIYADNIGGATKYKFEVKNGSNIQYYETTNRYFYLYNVNFQYNTTYSIRVAVETGGSFGAFGNGCSITTPAGPAVAPSQCGIAVAASGTPIYSTFVPNATNYKFKVVKGANVQYFTSTNRWFTFDDLTSFTYNTNYNVSVSVEVGGVYGPFGNTCVVTSPTTKIVDDQCNKFINSKFTKILAYDVPGATAYRFRIVNGSNVQIIQKTNRFFTLQDINYNLNTTYSVSVSVIIGGVLSPYGQVCTITTPASNLILLDDDIKLIGKEINLNTFPNPSNGEFTISSSHEGTFNIVNELGQLVRQVVITKENGYSEKVEGLKQGIYFVTGTIDSEVITKKVIVQ